VGLRETVCADDELIELSQNFVQFRALNINFCLRYQCLGAFTKLPIATISFVMSVRLSVRPHETTLFPLDGFALSFFFLVFGFLARQPLVGQSLLIKRASRSHPVRHATLGRTPLDE